MPLQQQLPQEQYFVILYHTKYDDTFATEKIRLEAARCENSKAVFHEPSRVCT